MSQLKNVKIDRTLGIDRTLKILSQLDTGDIVLLSGGGFFSSLVKYFTSSKWSHVGVVLRHKNYPQPLIWQSVSHEMEDVRGYQQSGVILTDLINTISKYYSNDIGIRKLSHPLSEKDLQIFNKTFEELDGRPYESGLSGYIELYKSAQDSWTAPNDEALDRIFCSELVAELYMRLGFIEKTIAAPSSEYTPQDFENMHCHAGCDYQLGELVVLPLCNSNVEQQ